MFIKKTFKKKALSFSLFTKYYFFFTIFILGLFLIFFSQTGVWENNKKDFLNRIYFNGINNYLKVFKILNTAKKKFSFDYKKIEINIPFENVIKIEKNRKDLIDNSIISGSERNQNTPFINTSAEIISENKNYRVNIRLKGDRTSHFREKDKSSYKIEIRGDDRINGMKKFSFIKPRMRNYIHEWLFHEFSSENNLIKINYEFVDLIINGSNEGLYVMEENFGKELIERNKRRNGPIFSLLTEYSADIYNSKLEVYNKEYWNNSENIKLYDFARKKFQSYLNGELKVEETFDLKKWAWFFAVSDLTYTYHGTDPNNVKLYYNPVNGLLEPIPYDGHRVNKNFNKNLNSFESRINLEMANDCLNEKNCKKDDPSSYWVQSFFYNKDKSINKLFYKEYIEALIEISDKNFIDNFFQKRENSIERINAAIYTDYFLIDNLPYDKFGPGIYYFNKEDTYHRAKILRDKIKPLLNKIYVTENKSFITFENKDVINHQLKISKIICNKLEAMFSETVNEEIGKMINFNEKIIIKKGVNLNNTKCEKVEFEDKKGKLFVKNIVFSPNINFINNFNKNFRKYFKINNKKLYLINNEVKINENIFIPSGYTVEIKAKEKIILTNNAFIYSKSPWRVGEQKKDKTQISGLPDNFGGGLFISNSEKKSEFTNTNFSYLSGMEKNEFLDTDYNKTTKINTKYSISQSNKYIYSKNKFKKKNYKFLDGKILYGSLNFYNTNAILKDCKFFRIDSEDAVNFISSSYIIDNTIFDEISGDAIDIDFGDGNITNSKFTNIGNDGIDLSGTNGNLKNLNFDNIVDKIVSSGENTEVKIENISGSNSYIGVASKDGSKTLVKNINLNNVEIAFASYIKKKSYEKGFIEVSGELKINRYDMFAINDNSSEIIIDGEQKGDKKKNIVEIIYKKELL